MNIGKIVCDWCRTPSYSTKHTPSGNFCNKCSKAVITQCNACEYDVFKPDAYIVTKFNEDGKKKHTYFCDDRCAEKRAEWNFIEEWA